MTFKIMKDFFPIVEKKINRIAKKAAKYGNPFTFKVVDEVVEEVTNDGVTENYPFVIIELDGKAQVGEYLCVAVLEMHKTGNIIKKIIGSHFDTDIPERFLHSENECEHCHTKRNRKQLYIVYNCATREFKQVGSDCLALYAGGMNPQYIAAYYDCITELEECDSQFYSGYGTPMYEVTDVLRHACEIIVKTGYFNSESDLPTKVLLRHMFTGYTHFSDLIDGLNEILRENKMYDVCFSKGDFDKDETEEQVNKIIEYYKSLDATSEFIHNVQVLLSEDYVTMSNFGYLCFLPEGYNRHVEQQKQLEKQMAEKKSAHYGEVGKRYASIPVAGARMLTGWETIYGYNYLYEVVLQSGEVLIWKTGTWFCKEDLEKFKAISFTVKNHSDYKGFKQTDVTRCKFAA